MPLSAEWRIFGEFDVLLILSASGEVKEALTVDVSNLHDFLTQMDSTVSVAGDLPILHLQSLFSSASKTFSS